MLSQLNLHFHKKLIEALKIRGGTLAVALTGLCCLYGDLQV